MKPLGIKEIPKPVRLSFPFPLLEREEQPYVAEVEIGEVCTQTYTTWARGIGQARRRLRAETNGSIVAIAKLAEGKTIRHWRSR